MGEKRHFPLYEHLSFYWKKKLFFIIIPVMFILLGVAGSYLIPKDGKYEGSATIFTGGIKLKALSDPEYLVAIYGAHVNGAIDAYVSSDSYIKVKIYDDQQEAVTADLDEMVSQIADALQSSYDLRKGTTENYAALLEERITKLSEAKDLYLENLKNEDLTIQEVEDYTDILAWTEVELTDVQTTLQRINNDLAFFEQPAVVNHGVTATNTYTKEFAVAGFLLGLFMTFVLLSLWKYILDARRYGQHD